MAVAESTIDMQASRTGERLFQLVKIHDISVTLVRLQPGAHRSDNHANVIDPAHTVPMILFRFTLALASSLLLIGATRAEVAPDIVVAKAPEGYRIHVEALLPAPPRQVWAALTDCARAKSFVPHLESCRILSRDPAGRWDVRENVANPPFLARVRTIVRSDYQPIRGFTYKLVSGDMRKSEGAWTLTPKGSGTHIVYEALVDPDMAAPSMVITAAIRSDLPSMFRKLDELSRAVSP
jgi:uncharacterized protein YndB with AHSA1/START domain